MFKKMFKDPETFASRSVKGPDQMMLQKYVWKTWGKWSSMQHGNYISSSYLNGKFDQLTFLKIRIFNLQILISVKHSQDLLVRNLHYTYHNSI